MIFSQTLKKKRVRVFPSVVCNKGLGLVWVWCYVFRLFRLFAPFFLFL